MFDQASFPKKTNEELADWSDVQGFIAALNAPKTDAAVWRANLSVLDEPTYLQAYRSHLQTLHDTNMHPDTLDGIMDGWHALIEPYVVGTNGEAAPYTHLDSDADYTNSLTNATDGIKPHIDKRLLDIEAALAP